MPDGAHTPLIHILGEAEALAARVAGRFIELACEAIEERRRFSVALAGGSTPRRVYQLLAEQELSTRLDWRQVHIFFGDERCVPPDDVRSNYRMASEAFLSRVPMPAGNVRRMRGEGDPDESARLYEETLRRFFSDAAWPRFDLVLLGMGEDGHTASLFPHTPALAERRAWVVANAGESLETARLTLTLPAINHAAHLLFIVSGAAKSMRLKEVLDHAKEDASGGSGRTPLPAALVRPVSGTLEWFVDRGAAAHLR